MPRRTFLRGLRRYGRSAIPGVDGAGHDTIGAVLSPAALSVPVHAADSALLAAVKKSDFARVQRLLQQGASVSVSEAADSTALHWAVESDNPEMTRSLHRAGADAKRANRYGITPCTWPPL